MNEMIEWLAIDHQRETAVLTLATLVVAAGAFARVPGARMPLLTQLVVYGLGRGLWAAVPLARGAGLATTADVLAGGAILVLGIAAIRVWTIVVFRHWLPGMRLAPPRILEDIVMTFACLAWGAMRLHEHGVNLAHIVTTSAILTAVLAFAMQDTLGNILAGLALQWDQSITVGDWVTLDDQQTGRVCDVTWRATWLRLRNGDTLVVPNSALTRGRFRLVGKHPGPGLATRRKILFDVTLETLPTQIIGIVEHELREARLDHVAAEPRPQCLLTATENGLGRFQVRYWLTNLEEDETTDSLVRTAIDAALRRSGRRLSPPQYNVLMSVDGKKFNEARSKRHTGERLAMLSRLDLLAALTDDERRVLAERLRFTPYVPGDVVVEPGSSGEWLYIVTLGEVEQYVELKNGTRRSLGRVGPGSFFGELSLMTGEPSPLAVVSRGNVECYRLDRESFHSLILARQELADAFSRVLAERLARRQALLAEAAQQPAVPSLKHGEVLARMRVFLGLRQPGMALRSPLE